MALKAAAWAFMPRSAAKRSMEEAPKNYSFFRVDVSDLQGGHSGDDIDKGRVNSNKTVARLLWDGMQSFELKLSYFNGGNLRNAIPREAYAIFGIPTRFKSELSLIHI